MNLRKKLLKIVGLTALAVVCVGPSRVAAQVVPQDQLPPPPRPRRVEPTPTPLPTPEATNSTVNDTNIAVGDDEIVRVSSNLVVVPVSVTDGLGNPVFGLKTEDFRLQEEGRAKEITGIGDPGQVPLDIALLLDVSGSVNARFDFERDAAARFLREVLKPGDQAAIFTIGDKSQLIQPLGTPERALAQLQDIQPARGATAFYDTLSDAIDELRNKSTARRRRVIIVISDGVDNFSDKIRAAMGSTAETQGAVTQDFTFRTRERERNFLQREIQRAEAVFYSINPSASILHLDIPAAQAENGMEKLAQATGGNSFIPQSELQLATAFRQIAAELRSQYLLQYYANDDVPAGQYLRISVATPAHPAYTIRARQGYYAKRR